MPHTVEEAYEVADAANGGDPAKLLDELGDLLFQTYFLALLLEEEGHGDLEAVARNVHAKLRRRHPHVFGEAEADSAGRVRERWEAIKTEQEGRTGVFHDVPETLPSLLQARKVQRRAAAAGFDWPDLEGPIEKVQGRAGRARVRARSRGTPGTRDRARPEGLRRARRPPLHPRQRRPRRERRSGARAAGDEQPFRRPGRAGRAARRRRRSELDRSRPRDAGRVVPARQGAARSVVGDEPWPTTPSGRVGSRRGASSLALQ